MFCLRSEYEAYFGRGDASTILCISLVEFSEASTVDL